MTAHQCYHCKQWIEEGEAHDCWTTTESALTGELSEDLREAWQKLLPGVPTGHDYVLVARPGIAEPVAARGQDWLVDEVSGALEKVRS